MQKLRENIIKLIEEIEDEKKLKVIYQFIRGIKGGH